MRRSFVSWLDYVGWIVLMVCIIFQMSRPQRGENRGNGQEFMLCFPHSTDRDGRRIFRFKKLSFA